MSRSLYPPRRLLIPVAFFLTIVTVLWNYASLSDLPEHVTLAWTKSTSTATYCSRQDIDNGEWEVTGRISSYEDIPLVYGYKSWKHNYCGAIGAVWNEGNAMGQPIEVERQRKIDVSEPVYVKAGQCVYRDGDLEEKIIHLLRMPSGAFLIGDSIVLQISRVFDNIFVGEGSPVTVEQEGSWDWYPLARFHSLDPNHPDTNSILNRAGVSKERLNYPLISWYRTSYLLPTRELILSAFDGIANAELPGFSTDQFVDWFDRLNTSIPAAREAVTWKDGYQEEPTSILIHGGPHFVPGELGHHITEEEIIQGFYGTVDRMETLMRSVPYPSYLYWETTTPGHIDCGLQTNFDNQRTLGLSPFDLEKPLYNYNLFPIFNDYIRQKFPDDSNRRSTFVRHFWNRIKLAFDSSSTPTNPTFRVMDTWSLSVKRPDAHRGPPADCLHFCSTGVPDEWAKVWWHLMFEEAVNSKH